MSCRVPTCLLAVLVTAAALTPPVPAAMPCAGQILPMLFYSGFEGGSLEGFVLYPQTAWIPGNANTALECITMGTGQWNLAWIIQGFGWTDHNLQASVRFLEGANNLGVVFRFRQPGDFYLFVLSGGNTASLMRSVGGVIDRVESVPYTYQTDRWYVLRMELVGNLHKAYVNGLPVLSWTDSTHPMGSGGVAAKDTRAWFDNVTSLVRPSMPQAGERPDWAAITGSGQ